MLFVQGYKLDSVNREGYQIVIYLNAMNLFRSDPVTTSHMQTSDFVEIDASFCPLGENVMPQIAL